MGCILILGLEGIMDLAINYRSCFHRFYWCGQSYFLLCFSHHEICHFKVPNSLGIYFHEISRIFLYTISYEATDQNISKYLW